MRGEATGRRVGLSRCVLRRRDGACGRDLRSMHRADDVEPALGLRQRLPGEGPRKETTGAYSILYTAVKGGIVAD
jgi:hypothetical protein